MENYVTDLIEITLLHRRKLMAILLSICVVMSLVPITSVETVFAGEGANNVKNFTDTLQFDTSTGKLYYENDGNINIVESCDGFRYRAYRKNNYDPYYSILVLEGFNMTNSSDVALTIQDEVN